MSAQFEISGQNISEYFERYVETTTLPDPEDWRNVLERKRHELLVGKPAPREHWVGLYSTRAETAATRNAELARELSRVTDELSHYGGDHLSLVMISDSGYGYFVWLDDTHDSVISCLRLRDKRVQP